jgi:16S rRNA (uracil1498-N3)-methyltransferase
MARLFIDKKDFDAGVSYTINNKEILKIIKVLRLKCEDNLELFNNTGIKYFGLIKEINKNFVKIFIEDKKIITKNNFIKINLIQGLSKRERFEFVIQKATELDVSSIYPFVSTRTIPKVISDKLARWEKIAIEATRQCCRQDVPIIYPVNNFEKIIDSIKDENALKIIFYEEAKNTKSLNEKLSKKNFDSIYFIIGPEGGFSKEEVEYSQKRGFEVISIGDIILRTETAPIVILSIINYELGKFLPKT